jgi:hypothetical protein
VLRGRPSAAYGRLTQITLAVARLRRFDELDEIVEELKRKEKVDGRKKRE